MLCVGLCHRWLASARGPSHVAFLWFPIFASQVVWSAVLSLEPFVSCFWVGYCRPLWMNTSGPVPCPLRNWRHLLRFDFFFPTNAMSSYISVHQSTRIRDTFSFFGHFPTRPCCQILDSCSRPLTPYCSHPRYSVVVRASARLFTPGVGFV